MTATTSTTTSMTISSSSISSAKERLQIRYSGKVHIRGRIRRVWRPRYLELLSNGTLRYCYEMAIPNNAVVNKSTTTTTTTLIVYSARILDVTTLRDLHVGLPRGSFGFLVRAQRIIEENEEEEEKKEPPVTRDYHCAVDTLEEAQMWVVALQWAASLQPPLLSTSTTTEQWWKVDLNPSSISTSDEPQQQSQSQQSQQTIIEQQPQPPQQSQKKKIPSSTSAQQPQSPPQGNKILVTKVTGYTLVRVSGVWGWEIAYKIHVMMLLLSRNNNNNNNNNNSTTIINKENKNKNTKNCRSSTVAEQWTVLRTATDLQRVMEQLHDDNNKRDDDDDKSKDGATAKQQQQQKKMLSSRMALAQWNDRPSTAQVERSVTVLDSVLRSWVLDRTDIVNAVPAVKQFLGLAAAASSSSLSSSSYYNNWWQIHNGSSIQQRTTVTVPSDMSNDQYVKQWLSSPSPSSSLQQKHQTKQTAAATTTITSYWQSRLIQCRHDYPPLLLVGGGAGFLTATTVVLPLAIRHHIIMPTVSLRLDVLVCTWIGAAYVGRYYMGQQQQQHWSMSGGEHNKRHHHHHPITTTGSRKGTPVSSSAAGSHRVHHHHHKKTTSTPLRRQKAEDDESVTTPNNALPHDDSAVMVHDETDNIITDYGDTENDDVDDDDEFMSTGSQEIWEESDGEEESGEEYSIAVEGGVLSSPLPKHPENDGVSCWSQPADDVFYVRGVNYFNDKVKVASGAAPLKCRGVDIWVTDNPPRHIARHPAVLGGKLAEKDTFLVNFLLPFGNFVAYFEIPPLHKFPDKLRTVWTKFLKGDQQYRDARLKLLPYVVEGPWIVKTAVGPGKSPALLGKVIPLQYYFRDPDARRKGVYEVDVIITASSIAKGILSVVKSQTNAVTIAFAFIIEAAEQSELPETVLCSFQIHSMHLEDCPVLPECDLDELESF